MVSFALLLACSKPTTIKIDAPESVRRGDSFTPTIAFLDQNGQPIEVGDELKLALSDSKVASLEGATVTTTATGAFEIKVSVGDALTLSHEVRVDDPIIGQWMVEKWRFEHKYGWAPTYFDGSSLTTLDQKKWSKGEPKELWYNVSNFVVQVQSDRNGHVHAVWKDTSGVDIKTVQFGVWSDDGKAHFGDAANGTPAESAAKCFKGNAEAGSDIINHIRAEARESMYAGKVFSETLGFEPTQARCARTQAWPAEAGDDFTIVLAPDGKSWSGSTWNGQVEAKFMAYP